ncbi:MAG: helix-turn-helix domain-containing protein [Candidatus Dormibacteria bacterium]
MDSVTLLRTTREGAGLSQRTLARLAGTSQAAISCYERGTVSPSVRTLARLLAACREGTAKPEGGQWAAHIRPVLGRFPMTAREWECRPYFMWSSDTSWREVANALQGSNVPRRRAMLATVLDEAKWDDIWRLVSPTLIASELDALRIRRKSTWRFFLEHAASVS